MNLRSAHGPSTPEQLGIGYVEKKVLPTVSEDTGFYFGSTQYVSITRAGELSLTIGTGNINMSGVMDYLDGSTHVFETQG